MQRRDPFLKLLHRDVVEVPRGEESVPGAFFIVRHGQSSLAPMRPQQ
jgi:hypothetical protein